MMQGKGWLTALILALLVVGGCSRGRAESPRPNVVLVSIDCLNQRQFAAAIENGDAPNLRALASRSLVYTRAYAHAPWTTPSHMSMLSGLYPSQHGRNISVLMAAQYGELGERVSDYETIGERLAAVGYETVAFVGKGSISAKFGLGQGFSSYNEFDQENPDKADLPGSIAAMERWLAARKPGPFFLFFHTYDLHYPLPPGRPTDAAAIRHIDTFLARLFDRLEEKGLTDSTLLFLTGDHGSSMIHTEGKCCLHGAGHYEENLRVPLLVHLPGTAAEAKSSDAIVRHVDLLPTVLDVLDLPRGSYAGEGLSLLATDRPANLGSFSEADARCAARNAVAGRRYKYIYSLQDPVWQALRWAKFFFGPLCVKTKACFQIPREELYDLQSDPFEEHDLLKAPLTSEAENALEKLRAEMERSINLPRAYHRAVLSKAVGPTPAPTLSIDGGVKESLRALGYLE